MSQLEPAIRKRERLFLNHADGRTFKAKRYKAIRAGLLARFPAPHEPVLVALIEATASLQLQLEVERQKQAEGEPVSSEMLVKLTNGLRRHLRDLALAEPESDES